MIDTFFVSISLYLVFLHTVRLNCNFALSFSWGVSYYVARHKPTSHRGMDTMSNTRLKQKRCVPQIDFMNYTNLVQVAQQCPDMTIAVKLNDLVEFGNILISNVKNELEQTFADQNAETYLSIERVMEMLGVCRGTLWRWNKIGYLCHLNVGGKRRYKMSDVMRIIEGDNTQKGVKA